MYSKEFQESLKAVEAAREANIACEPARMTADEKDKLLAIYDYTTFTTANEEPYMVAGISDEYELDKDGNPTSVYPDKDNHSIDAVRYAMEKVWKKKGR